MKRPEGLGLVSKKRKLFFGRQFVFLLGFVQAQRGGGQGGEGRVKERKEGCGGRQGRRGKVAKSGRRRDARRGGRGEQQFAGFSFPVTNVVQPRKN